MTSNEHSEIDTESAATASHEVAPEASGTSGDGYSADFVAVPAVPGSSTSIWNSLVAPLKRLWEIPTIHLSTHYGACNQLGRPGPVLSVLLERSTCSCNRVKQRLKRLQSQQSKATSAAAPPTSKFRLDFPIPSLGKGSTSSSGSVTSGEDVAPEIEGVVVVTPRAIERYRLDGTIIKRAALPHVVTSFLSTKIAGVGRVFLCGTQVGRVHVLKAELLDPVLEFDTGCLKGAFLNAFRRAQEKDKQSPTEVSKQSQFSYAMQSSPVPSVFANPPWLLAEALLEFQLDQSASHLHTIDIVRLRAESGTTMVEEAKSLSSIVSSDAEAPKIEDVIHRMSTITGDGMTPALIEGQLKKLGHEAGVEFGMLQKFLQALEDNRPYGLYNQFSASLEQPVTATKLSLLSTLLCQLKAQSSGICSLAVKGSFANFSEALLAGTTDGEVFVWEVPSGRLLVVLEYPSDSVTGKNDACVQPPSHVAAIQVPNITTSTQYVWVGYGNGNIAVFDLSKSICLKTWNIAPSKSIISMEVAIQLNAMVIVSGECDLSVWTLRDFTLLETFCCEILTCGVSISCAKVEEPEKRTIGSSAAVVFLGCSDGSICVHRLGWGTVRCLPSDIKTQQNEASSSQKMQKIATKKEVLECALLRAYRKESEPICPVTSICIDSQLDTAFVGDASGIVVTLLPIRHLLEASYPPPIQSSGTSSSFPRGTFIKSGARDLHASPTIGLLPTPEQHVFAQSRIQSEEFGPKSSATVFHGQSTV